MKLFEHKNKLTMCKARMAMMMAEQQQQEEEGCKLLISR
jgi:hypothetical protein